MRNRSIQRFTQGIIASLLVALLSITSVGITPASVHAADAAVTQGPGFDLGTELLGTFAPLTEALESLIMDVIQETGLNKVPELAESLFADLEQGRVPVIGKLADPFTPANPVLGEIDAGIAEALAQTELVAQLMGAVLVPAAKDAFQYLLNSPLVIDGEYAITTPIGRARLTRAGGELSLCVTNVGPAGSRITQGISNGEYLCGIQSPRMANPLNQTIYFTDVAMGYSHYQAKILLFPSLSHPLSPPPTLFEAVTFVDVNGQWLQIRLSGADFDSIYVDAELKIGVKGGFNVAALATVEGIVILSYRIKPVRAAGVIQGVAQVMLTKLAELSSAGAKLVPDDPADLITVKDAVGVLLAGLNHLHAVEMASEEELGNVKLSVAINGQLGAGIWDTGLAGASTGASLATTMPLNAAVTVGATALEEYVDTALRMGDLLENLSTALLQGQGEAAVVTLLENLSTTAGALVQSAIDRLLTLVSELEMEFTFELALLGRTSQGTGDTETAPTSIPLINTTTKVPIGEMAKTLRDEPETITTAIVDAIEAGAKFTLYALRTAEEAGTSIAEGIVKWYETPSEPYVLPPLATPEDWQALYNDALDQVTISVMVMGAGLSLTGLKDVSLGALLKVLGDPGKVLDNVLTGMIKTAESGQLDFLRVAIEQAALKALQYGLDQLIGVLKTTIIPFSKGFGANGDIGAEALFKIGLGGTVSGEVKTSLLLLLINYEYEEDHGTNLVSLSMPIKFNLTGGASVAEIVELTVDVGATAGLNYANFTIKHWDGDLPPPPGMTVAGFEVLAFRGVVLSDQSITGTGYLMLPIGGIVRAEFNLDPQGNVREGATWTGGFELGPLGNVELATGRLDNAGIHGQIDLPISDSTLTADFNLQASGRLYGSFATTIVIEGQTLGSGTLFLQRDGSFAGSATVTIAGNLVQLDVALLPDGTFNGRYEGVLTLGGHTISNVLLLLEGSSFSGEGYFDLLGNSAKISLTIGLDGQFGGSYEQGLDETVGVAGFGLTGVTLALDSTGLVGTASMQLLESTFTATDLRIEPSGTASGTFTGDLVVAGHTLSNVMLNLDGDRFTGSGSTNLLGNTAHFDLLIDNNGVHGKYQQTEGQVFGIVGYGLSGVELTLDDAGVRGSGNLALPGMPVGQVTNLGITAQGQVTGQYDGLLHLLGFVGSTELALTENGLSGTGSLQVLESTLTATNLIIDTAGRVRGTFDGQLIAAGQTLAVSSLEVLEDRIVGTTQMDIPGVSGATMAVTLSQGAVSARYDGTWNLLGTGTAEAEFILTTNSILVQAQMQNDFLQSMRQTALGTLTDVVALAQGELAVAIQAVAAAQAEVDKLQNDKNAVLAQIAHEREVARQALLAAETVFNTALVALNTVVDTIAGVNRDFAALLADAEWHVNHARNEVNRLFGDLSYWNQEIDNLDAWYWGNEDYWHRTWNWAHYSATHASLVISRDAAQTALWTADGVLWLVEQALAGLRHELTNTLAPLLENQHWRQVALNDASHALSGARQAFESIPLDPNLDPRMIVLNTAHGIATLGLNTAQGLLHFASQFMGGILDIANFIDQHGSGLLIDVRSASFEAELSTLFTGRVLMYAEVAFLDQITDVSFPYDFFDPIGSAIALAGLISPDSIRYETAPGVEPPGGWNDSAPPSTTGFAPTNWLQGNADVTLRALDIISGIASVSYSASGAQSISQTVVAGDTVQFTVTAEGVTTITYFATDWAGNVEAAKSLTVRIDRTGPAASGTAPSGWQKDRADLALTPVDAGSGVASITYSTAGAMNTSAAIVSGESLLVQVNAEGETTVNFHATDLAGNQGPPGTLLAQIDRTAPETIAVGPSVWLKQATTVELTATDAHSGVASIRYSATGAQTMPNTTAAGSAVSIPITAEGITTLTYYALDQVGHEEAPQSLTVMIDLTMPTVSASAPESWVNSGALVEITASDEVGGSGLAVVTISSTGAQSINAAGLPGLVNTLQISAEGVTTLSYSATDVAGNVTASQSLTVKVDLTNPVTTAVAPTTWQNETVTVALSGTDNLSGVASITYSAVGAHPIESTVVPGNQTSFQISGQGVTTISYFATDIAGNVEAENSITILVTTPLTVTTADKSKVYGEDDPTLAYTITSGKLVGEDQLTGGLTREPGENVGIYAITQGSLMAGENYDMTYAGANLTITARPLTVTITAQTKVYGEDDPELTYTITSGELVATDAFTGSLTRVAGESVGTYAIEVGTLSAGSNYDVTYVSSNLTVTARPLTVTADEKSKVYGESDPVLTYTITSGKLLGTDAFIGNQTRVSGEGVGTYAIQAGTLSAGSNYDLIYVGGSLAITARPLTITAAPKSKVYGEDDPALIYAITSGDLVGTDAFGGSLTRANGESVGAYAIQVGTVSAGSNYDVTYVGDNLTITAKSLVVTADANAKTYGETFTFAGTELTTDGLINGDTITAVTLSSAGAVATAAVDSYDIVASAAVGTGLINYTISYTNGILTVNPKALMITATNQSKIYGQTSDLGTTLFSTPDLVNNDTVTSVTFSSIGAVATAAVDSYNIVASAAVGTGLSNYTISYTNGILTVNPKALTITADFKSTRYGEGLPPFTATYAGFVLEQDHTALSGTLNLQSAAIAGSTSGNYRITPSGLTSTDYAITYVPGILHISSNSLTVTVGSATRPYGSQNPTFDVSYSGLVAGDTPGSLSGTLALTVDANPASPVGTFTVTASGLTSADYSIDYVAGSLTITPAPLRIIAEDASRLFGLPNPPLTGRIEGPLSDQIQVSYATTATTFSPAGTYPIVPTLSGGVLANYEVSLTNGSLTVIQCGSNDSIDGTTACQSDDAASKELLTGLLSDDAGSTALSQAGQTHVDQAIEQAKSQAGVAPRLVLSIDSDTQIQGGLATASAMRTLAENAGELMVKTPFGQLLFTPKSLAQLVENEEVQSVVILFEESATEAPVQVPAPRGTQLRSASPLVDIVVATQGTDGSFIRQERFPLQVLLTLPTVLTGVDQDLLGVYRFFIDEQGTMQIEYVGGNLSSDGEGMTVDRDRLSFYGILEYDRQYDDLPVNHWAHRSIQVMSARHVVQGVGESQFEPNRSVTRAEFATMLVRSFGVPVTPVTTSLFGDVAPHHWHASIMAAVVKAGLFTPEAGDRLRPDQPITREEMAVAIARTMSWIGVGLPTPERNVTAILAPFVDARELSQVARAPMAELIATGLVKGRAADLLAPQGISTRAEATTLIHRLLEWSRVQPQ